MPLFGKRHSVYFNEINPITFVAEGDKSSATALDLRPSVDPYPQVCQSNMVLCKNSILPATSVSSLAHS